MNEVALSGLDASNPLGFLASVGVLELLADRGVDARLRYADRGWWTPLVAGVEGGIDAIVEHVLADRSACRDEPALALEYDGKRDLKAPPDVLRRYLEDLVVGASPARRRGVDLAAAFASEVSLDGKGACKPSALHFTAGQQHFLKMVDELLGGINEGDIREALEGPWRYARPLPVLGWDATMARDYALRASDPSQDKKLGVPGADWLAFRGLAAFPVAPTQRGLLTTGCAGGWKRGGRFTWALWSVALSRPEVRVAVGLDVATMPAAERRARGIAVVYRCGITRTDQGGYGAFDPAVVV